MLGGSERYVVTVSRRAVEMLENHACFLANVSADAARKLEAEFIEGARSLESMPERGSWLNDAAIPRHKYRKLLFGNRYMIIYAVSEKHVSIDAVLDVRRDNRWILP